MGTIWARLLDGNHAYASVEEAYRRHLLPNLMINAHGMPQVGDAFGLPSAILEMLVQSHEGKIVLLPALPDIFASGKVGGLHLRGGHILDMEWRDKKVVRASIRHLPGSVDMPVISACGQTPNVDFILESVN